MHRPKRWTIAPPDERAPELAARLKTSPLLAQILLNRGVSEPAEVVGERGVGLIISDHYEWHIERGIGSRVSGVGNSPPTPHPRYPLLPACFTIVHPPLPGSPSPNPNL